MSYFGIPIRNGLMLGLGAVMSFTSALANLVDYYLMTEGSDNLVTETNDKILLEQNYG
jgi:nucleoside recognition membrane protein YjiH